MWSSSGRRVLQELLSLQAARGFRGTAAQNTVVVERWWQVPLSRVGRPPRLHPRRHRIYKLVEDKKNLPQEKMELILTETVPKLGGRGDVVFVKKSVGRNKLLAQGLAVYASPENRQMFAEELRLLQEGSPEERSQTRTGQLTVEFLQHSKLSFRKMPCEEYQITKAVVIRQLAKKLGVVAQPHAVNFPFESAKDVGDYWCEITVNGLDTVRLPISVLPYEDMSAKHQRQLKAQRKQEAAANVSAAADVSAASEAAAVVSATSEAAAFAAAEAAVDISAAPEAAADVSAAPEAAADVSAAPEAAVDVSATGEAVADVSAAPEAAVDVSAAGEEAADVSAAPEEAAADVPAAPEAAAGVSAAPEAAVDVSATPEAAAGASAASEAAVDISPAAEAAVADVATADIAAKEKDDGVLKVASDAPVEAEAAREASGNSASEETEAPTQTARDTAAPGSENKEQK